MTEEQKTKNHYEMLNNSSNKALVDLIKMQDNEIEQLKKQNKELQEELTKKADTNHSLVEQMADLESENAELKEKLEIEQNARGDWFGKAVTKDNQLTKAIELIKEMLSILPKENIEGIYEITEEAEQFLRESE